MSFRLWRARGGAVYATVRVAHHVSFDDAINLVAAYRFDDRNPEKRVTKAEIEDTIRSRLWSEGNPLGSETSDMQGGLEEDALEWAAGEVRRHYPTWEA